MDKSEFGVFCIRIAGSLLVFTQAARGHCLHIVDNEKKIQKFSQFFHGRPENSFVPMTEEEVDAFQCYLEGLRDTPL